MKASLNKSAHSGWSSIKQSGAVIVVCMALLLLVTLLGLSAAQFTTSTERMAASTRDKDLAFQAAEAALRVAEQRVKEAITGREGFSEACSNGLCTVPHTSDFSSLIDNPDACGAGKSIWECGKSVALSGADALDADLHSQQPRYFIEVLADLTSEDQLNLGNIGDKVKNAGATVYRISAIGYGGSASAKVLLQASYGK